MTQNYRVLVAAMWLPHPPSAFYRRYELMKRLSKRYEITLVGGAPDDRSQISELRSLGVNIIELEWDRGPSTRQRMRKGTAARLNTLRATLGSLSPSQAYWVDASLPRGRSTVRSLVVSGSFDLLHVDSFLAHWLRGLRIDLPLAVDFDGVNSALILRQATLEGAAYRRALLRIDAYKLRRYERRAAAQADVCITTSLADNGLLRSLYLGVKAFDVPNGVDTRYYRPDPPPSEDDGCLLYFGSMAILPNVDAVRYFVDEILPLVRSRAPRAHLKIVGTGPSEEVLSLGLRDGVEVVGAVPDMRPYLAHAALVVVPTRVASGTRGKILQALAMGKSVVSTSVGAEGLEVTSGELVLADTPTTFAAAVCDLLASPRRRQEMGTQGRRRVEHQYDWNTSADRLHALYAAVIQRRAFPPRLQAPPAILVH